MRVCLLAGWLVALLVAFFCMLSSFSCSASFRITINGGGVLLGVVSISLLFFVCGSNACVALF